MKKLLSFIVLIIVSFHLYCQEIPPIEYKPVKTDYLSKSKKQRTVGLILTTTGFAVTFTGYAIAMAHLGEALASVTMMSTGETESHSDAYAVLLLTGPAMFITGVIFVSIAKKNKRKALSISLINDSFQHFRYNKVVNTSVPSVRLQLQF